MQSAKPAPVFMATSPATLNPTATTASPIPLPTAIEVVDKSKKLKKDKKDKKDKKNKPPKPPRTEWHIPTLRFEVHDVAHPGAQRFLSSIDVPSFLQAAITGVLCRLYGTPDKQPTKVKRITLRLRDMESLAFTTGSKKVKEIHLSSAYIAQLSLATPEALAQEILGVIRHEMVHVWQYNGRNNTPGGLIEGIADWVRLKDGFIPPHWTRGGCKWDEGYQNTAYFLEWLEETYGEGTVRWINVTMKERYSAGMWSKLSDGVSVEELWNVYCQKYGIENPPPADSDSSDSSDSSNSDDSSDEELVVKRAVSDADGDDSDGVVVVKKVVYVTPDDHSEAAATRGTGTRPGSALSMSTSSRSPPGAADDVDPWPFTGEQALTELMKSRLQNLTYDGTTDGRRFVREFEGLVNRVAPDMSDDDKRLMLVTAFRGEVINQWYEETDLDDEMPFDVLAGLVGEQWKGSSGRERRRVEREAKMD